MRALVIALGLAALAANVALAAIDYFGTAVGIATAQGADPVGSLVAWGGAVATAALLGGVKRLDTRVTNSRAFRKLQPVLTLAGAFAGPWLMLQTGQQLDPAVFAQAPIATVASITAAELLSLFQKRKG